MEGTRSQISGKTDKKRLRRDLKLNRNRYQAKVAWKNVKRELFDRFFCVFFWTKRLRRSLEYTRNAVSSSLLTDAVVTDYSPRSLGNIDESILSSLEEIGRKEGVTPSRSLTWGWYEGLGSYFGEVIIRNLGGKWVFPPPKRIWQARFRRDMSLFYDFFFVDLNGSLIPVIKIARLRQDGSGRVRSLSQAYEQIAVSGSWSEARAHAFEARKAR